MHGRASRIHCRPGFKSHPELAQVYASSDLHVSASEFETLGNTVLEAHSCGIPVVVPRTQVSPLRRNGTQLSCTQGFLDTVADGDNGYLFTPGDRHSAAE